MRYEKGQYYNRHHDYISGHLNLPIGPRVYTFFIYLNEPQQGGGTRFSDLNVTVLPKKGSVAIWPSVLNEDPFEKEERTDHEALPIEEGIKYAANLWLHMASFFFLTWKSIARLNNFVMRISKTKNRKPPICISYIYSIISTDHLLSLVLDKQSFCFLSILIEILSTKFSKTLVKTW